MDEEELEENEENEEEYEEPKKPSNPMQKVKTAGKTFVNTTFDFAKKIVKFFASPSVPWQLKVAVIAIVGVVVLVVIILKIQSDASASAVNDTIGTYIASENVDAEGKKYFEEKKSLIKMPLKDINAMYEQFKTDNTFSNEVKQNYDYILGTKDIKDSDGNSSENSASYDILNMVKKAVAMAEKGGIEYAQDGVGRQTASTLEELDALTKTDCSGFVWSLFKTYLGIDIGGGSDAIKKNADDKKSENEWKAEIHEIGDGDLQPGDILYREGHVGLYVGSYGTNNHVDHGGGNDGTTLGPNNTNYEGKDTPYTHYIRYTNPNASISDNANIDYDVTFTKGQDGTRDDKRVQYITGSTNKVSTYKVNNSYTYSNGKIGSASVELVSVEIKIWNSDGSTGKKTIQVNKKLENIVKAMFEDIYNDPSHPVIISIGGFRGTDGYPGHPFGVAIDINPDQNPMPGSYGKIENYKPGVDPLSMDANHAIVKIIKGKYGWAWGGDFKTTKDYMHFSFWGG